MVAFEEHGNSLNWSENGSLIYKIRAIQFWGGINNFSCLQFYKRNIRNTIRNAVRKEVSNAIHNAVSKAVRNA